MNQVVNAKEKFLTEMKNALLVNTQMVRRKTTLLLERRKF
jgi:hypothetical protein